jgi:hypothetical protein
MAGFFTAAQAAPARSWKAVTPSDTVNLAPGCRGLWVGTAGDLALVGDDDHVETFTTANAGSFIPLGAKRVNDTDTTATNIIALY